MPFDFTLFQKDILTTYPEPLQLFIQTLLEHFTQESNIIEKFIVEQPIRMLSLGCACMKEQVAFELVMVDSSLGGGLPFY